MLINHHVNLVNQNVVEDAFVVQINVARRNMIVVFHAPMVMSLVLINILLVMDVVEVDQVMLFFLIIKKRDKTQK